MAASESLSEADVNRQLRVSNSQLECALKERVRQMDHSPQLDIMTQMIHCKDKCMCAHIEDQVLV